MKKPEPPPGRLIREGFLPGDPNPMKNYRIKKVVERGNTIYYVQRKFLWFWWTDIYQPSHIKPFLNEGRGFLGQGFFLTLEEAKEELRSDLEFNESLKRLSKTKPKPEYIYDLT